ncbi:MAG: hypothetical protein ACRDZO_07620 [Egibacteraceae bacterium]
MDPFFPLSGDVSQTINPWAIWLRSANQQLGFITIPEVERRIIEEVASYGRQLGWIIEALEVVISRLDRDGLIGPERAALDQFSDLAGRVERVTGKEDGTAVTLGRVDRLLADLHDLRDTDPEGYEGVVSHLRAALE